MKNDGEKNCNTGMRWKTTEHPEQSAVHLVEYVEEKVDIFDWHL